MIGDEGTSLMTVLENAPYQYSQLFTLQGSSEVDDKTEANRGLRIKVQTPIPSLMVTEQLKLN